MKRNILAAALAALALSLLAAPRARAQQAGASFAPGGAGAPAAAREGWNPRGGIMMLYALDPLTSSLCFADGEHGRVIQQRETRNRCSDVDFGGYSPDGLSVGVEGARRGRIVDLGDAKELQARYGYPETVGNGQGYASLHADGGRVLILKGSRPQTFQELKESAQLFTEGKSSASVPVKVGHIYLIRITDRLDKGFERLVKLRVLAHAPGESVTFLWHQL